MTNYLYLLRRVILKRIVPEIFWPTHVDYDGVRILVRGQPYSFGVKRLLSRGDYEDAERYLIGRFLHCGDSVLEMGSSIGILSEIIANKVGPDGRIIAIEADHELAKLTSTRLARYKNLSVHSGFAFPVWDGSNIKINNFDNMDGSLGGRVAFKVAESSSQARPGNVIDISSVCSENSFSPDVLVCDIEGSELILTLLPLNWPSSIKNVVLELHDHLLPNGASDIEAIINRILKEGFKLREKRGMNYWLSRD